MASLHCFMFVSVTHVLVWFAFTEETHSLVLHLHINRVAVDFPSLFSVCVCHPWSCVCFVFSQKRDTYGAWEHYLGLEHTDSTPKRSHTSNQVLLHLFSV
jgi:hypothetical protein